MFNTPVAISVSTMAFFFFFVKIINDAPEMLSQAYILDFFLKKNNAAELCT
jgi:hypothetical protein